MKLQEGARAVPPPMRVVLVLAAAALGAMLLTGPSALVTSQAGTASAQTSTYSPPTGAGMMGYMESYVMTHPYRIGSASNQAFMAAARNDLVTELQGLGLYVERHSYTSPSTGQNIIAYLNGTSKPNEWIVLSAHYDTVETTIYGAWDDGAGVAELLELARSYSTRTWNRTIIFAFFDDEEQGLYGSQAFVAKYKSKLVGNLNFDPPGLNYPCKDPDGKYLTVKASFNEVKTTANVPGYQKIKQAVIDGMNVAGVPTSARDLSPALPIASIFGLGLSGTSDHYNFDQQNVPNAFVGSLPTTFVTSNTKALNYPLHTPADDLATMIARCGGSKSTLEAAFDVQLKIATKAVQVLDA